MIEGRFLQAARLHVVPEIAAEVVRHVRAVVAIVETLEILIVEGVVCALGHVERHADQAEAIGGKGESRIGENQDGREGEGAFHAAGFYPMCESASRRG